MDEIKEIKEWIVDYLEKPSDNFGGMPVCPFVKKERMTERLLIDVWKPDEKSFLDLLERMNESEQYTSELLICKDSEDIKWEEVDRKKFQKSIQVLMEDKGYKDLKALWLTSSTCRHIVWDPIFDEKITVSPDSIITSG